MLKINNLLCIRRRRILSSLEILIWIGWLFDFSIWSIISILRWLLSLHWLRKLLLRDIFSLLLWNWNYWLIIRISVFSYWILRITRVLLIVCRSILMSRWWRLILLRLLLLRILVTINKSIRLLRLLVWFGLCEKLLFVNSWRTIIEKRSLQGILSWSWDLKYLKSPVIFI